jgi:hypothetical protein
MYSSRGQLLDIVRQSVVDGEKEEKFFQEYIENKYKKKLIKKSKYKSYDFALDKTHKIEYKGLHYSLDIPNNIATSSLHTTSKTITDTFLGLDKVIYYYDRKRRNPNLKFYVFYGFIQTSNNTIKKIIYRYIDISDILFQMIMDFPKKYYYNKEHVLIPISSLKSLDECSLLFNENFIGI